MFKAPRSVTTLHKKLKMNAATDRLLAFLRSLWCKGAVLF